MWERFIPTIYGALGDGLWGRSSERVAVTRAGSDEEPFGAVDQESFLNMLQCHRTQKVITYHIFIDFLHLTVLLREGNMTNWVIPEFATRQLGHNPRLQCFC